LGLKTSICLRGGYQQRQEDRPDVPEELAEVRRGESEDEDSEDEEDEDLERRVRVLVFEHFADLLHEAFDLRLGHVLVDLSRVDDEADALEAADPGLVFVGPAGEERREVDAA